jgi:hypothetical protein
MVNMILQFSLDSQARCDVLVQINFALHRLTHIFLYTKTYIPASLSLFLYLSLDQSSCPLLLL